VKWKFVLSIGIILVLGYFIWNTETFQREVFPEKYWSKKVEVLKSMTQLDEGMIRDAALELKKKQITMKLEVAQEINSAKSFGMDVEEARKIAIERIRSEFEVLKEELKMWREQFKKDKSMLEKAKIELSKYK
jgi:hypothetical protein